MLILTHQHREWGNSKRPRPKHLRYYVANNKRTKRLHCSKAKRVRAIEKNRCFIFGATKVPRVVWEPRKCRLLNKRTNLSRCTCWCYSPQDIPWKESRGIAKKWKQQPFFSKPECILNKRELSTYILGNWIRYLYAKGGCYSLDS